LTVTVGLAPNVVLPVPRSRFLVPVNAKSPFHTIGWFNVVTSAALVLSMVPPPMVNVPATVPRACAWLMLRVPEPRDTPPLKVLAADSVRVPVPSMVTLPVPVPITLLTVIPEAPPNVRS